MECSVREGSSRFRASHSPSIHPGHRVAGWSVIFDVYRDAQVALGVYSACEGGDGYSVPEAQPACANRKSAPRAVDLLIEYIVDSLKGQIELPRGSRVVQAGNANPG